MTDDMEPTEEEAEAARLAAEAAERARVAAMVFESGAWTEEEIAELAKLVRDHPTIPTSDPGGSRILGAHEMAEALIEMGLETDMPDDFTPRPGELALGTRVRTPNDGDGVVVRFAIQYEGEIPHRRHVIQHEDGTLRAEARADMTVL